MKIQIELLQPNLIASLTRDSSLAALYDVFICKKLSYTQSTAFFFFEWWTLWDTQKYQYQTGVIKNTTTKETNNTAPHASKV